MSRLQKDSTIPSEASTSKEEQEHRTLKVTLLCSKWRSLTDGDLSTITRELAIQLATYRNVNVSVLLQNCSREDKSIAESYNVKLIEADRVPGSEPVLCLSFPPINHAIDCIIGHGVHLGQVIASVKRNPNYSQCKLIQVVHTAPGGNRMFKNFSEGEKMQEKEIQLDKMADQVITIGPKLAKAYKDYLCQIQGEVDVFNLTPSIFSEFLEVKQATEERGTFCVLFFGSDDIFKDFEVKGYHIAARAIAELRDKSYKLKVVSAAGGKGDIVAEKLPDCGIGHQLIVSSFDDGGEVLANLFCEVDLAIMPSRSVGFGITALKALSAGLPVLVSGNSGLGEALMEVPFGSQSVVYSKDPKEWAKEIKRVREKKREVRLLEARFLRAKYLERYRWEEPCKSLVIKMRNLVFGEREQVVGSLLQLQQNASRWKINSNTDLLLPIDLKKIVSGKGYRISENPGSGNCMFYALSEQLEIVKRVKIHHFELRHSLVQYLREHPKMVDGTDLFLFVHGYATWGGYLTDMEQDGTWGDDVILWAAANCYQVAIHVISSIQSLSELIINPDFPLDRSKHLLLGHIHEALFVSLQPLQVPREEVMSQLVDVKMEPDTVQHLELKKNLLLDVKGITGYVIFRGEVTEKGSVWNLPEAAAYIAFHEGAVKKPLLFACSVLPPKLRSPPISSDELLVSNVIELSHDGPLDLELSGDDEGNVTVTLLHSASDLKGYEVVIKQLVDPHDNEWKDLETWHASENPEVSDWSQLVEATCTLSRCSSFAAIWRLKSFTFTRRTSVAPQFTCVVPDFPDLCVEVPLSSVPVDEDFSLTIKVQEFSSNGVEDIGIVCGPVIYISSSQNIVNMEPVTIKVPLALRESKHDFSDLSNKVIRILYLDSERKAWNARWRDITGQLEGPVTVKHGNVEFKVKHFWRFCVCVFHKDVPLLEDYFRRLFSRSMPQFVHFLTCLLKTPIPDTYSLLLFCYPNFKRAEVEKKLSSFCVPYQGEGKSKEPACVGDEFVVSLLAFEFVKESQRNEKVVLRFLGNEISDNSDKALFVRLDSKRPPIVKFSKDKELQKLLCEVPILKTREVSAVPLTVGVDQRVVPCKSLHQKKGIPNRVGLDPSDSESSSFETDVSDSESDGSSDTDRGTEEEDFGFIKRKPVRAKQEGHPEEMQQEPQGRRSSPQKRAAGHPEEMQQEPQGKRSSPRKRVAGHPEEMQQEAQGKRSSPRKRVAGYPEEMQQESQGKRSSLRKRVAGHPKEMQQESQGKRSSPRKPVAGHPEEMQQESQGKRSSPRKRVAGHPKEMQQESQGKRSSPQKRVAGHPEEMQQESQGKRSSLRKRVAGHPKEMQQESQGKRSSLRKRAAASSSTEVNLEKERGSAAKKPKRVAIGEPGTSGVSSTSKTRKFKEGVVTGDDLQTLGKAIGVKWDRLARRLPGVTEDDIEEIEDSRKTLSQRGFHMLKLWKTNNGEAADYKTLYNALVHELVQRKDLGEKYCLE